MLSDADLSAAFPALRPGDFAITSPPTNAYNCLAWAAGVDDTWWEPAAGPGYFWPLGLPCDYTILSLIRAYESLGFIKCASAGLEVGREKIALFADGDDYTHAARQLANGRWTSKLGEQQDIEHAAPESLEGAAYGTVVCYLKRLTANRTA